VTRGPAAARNAGAAATSAPVLAFCDSDTRPTPGALRRLLAQLDDPAVGIVGPRVVAAPDGPDDPAVSGWAAVRWVRGLLARYERVRSPLDLGADPGWAAPGRHPAYLPSTVLVVRRSAFAGFDETLTVGEDVDLCWRTTARARYEPSVRVGHEHRTAFAGWLRRRFDYGSSVGVLGRRHPGALAFVVVHPAAGLALAALGTGRPVLAAGLAGARSVRLALRLAPYGVPAAGAVRLVTGGIAETACTLGGLALGPWLPIAAAGMCRPGRPRRIAVAAMTGTIAGEWLRQRRQLDLVSYAALRVLDGAAGAAGNWYGCLRAGTLRSLLPKMVTPRWLASRQGSRSPAAARREAGRTCRRAACRG
jgi:mycofactocin system glycosyltransferase